MQMQIRQGDVLLTRLSGKTEAPEGMAPVARDGDRVILAYGEVTGHAHALSEAWVSLFEGMNGERLLVVADEPAVLRHEEHTAHELAPGTYRVVRQREYVPNALPSYVAD